MGTTVQTADIRPFHVGVPEEELAELRRRIAATRWPCRELVADRSQGVQLGDAAGARALLGDRVRLAQGRGEAERAAAVHDRDRRRRHPLHPRQVAARGRAAADHDPRLARLGRRAARDGRPADRPDRARRQRRGCLPARAALAARVRLLGRAGRGRLGPGPDRTGLGRADAPPRLHAATWPRAATSAPASPTRWAARHPRA